MRVTMELFHGSYLEIPKPKIIVSNRMLDYGTGFYTTTDIAQAARFTEKFIRLERERIVSIYRYDESIEREDITKLIFTEPDSAWLDYVVANRSGKGIDNDYDIVMGPVANDRVYTVVESYELGDYTADEAIKRLKTYRLTGQIVWKSNRALSLLSFTKSIPAIEVEQR
jgi:hypothetical protein